ncbi:MAG: hypothetical protein IJ511_08225 [Bacteroides sp.]|nr:hypothetical protein [Bacteroides sp.]
MKRIIIRSLILLSLWPAILSAQELHPSFECMEFDLLARTKPRLDLNEEQCAVLRVSVADSKSFVFEGNIIGDVIYTPGEALIYMPDRTRNITIKSDRFGRMEYEFPERLKRLVVYKLSLKLTMPEPSPYELKEVNDEGLRKLARKEAKNYAKKKWEVAPGSLPLEEQLANTYTIQRLFNDRQEPKYLTSMAICSGRTYEMARIQALELAKIELANLMESSMQTITENAVGNSLISDDEAGAVQQTMLRSRNKVMQRIGKIRIVMELHREQGKQKEVLLRIAYDQEECKRIALQTLSEELQQEDENLSRKFSQAAGL